MSEKIEEEKNCKNCLYYLQDNVCVNYNPNCLYKVNPPEMKNCLLWSSKEKGSDDIPI